MNRTVACYFAAPKVYRIGLFGGKSSCKTSLLAALGLSDRPPHPAGYSASRLVRLPRLPDESLPGGDPDAWTPDDLRRDPVRAFVRGNRWIAQAEADLRVVRQPEGNAASIPSLLLVYQITDPELGIVTVEVVDFAGEQINAANTATENRAALDRFLKTIDGLLVFAEAPHPGGHAAMLGGELDILRSAFQNWTDGRRDGTRVSVPVALVLSKWDRRGNPEATPAERDAQVAELFAASPGHQTA